MLIYYETALPPFLCHGTDPAQRFALSDDPPGNFEIARPVPRLALLRLFPVRRRAEEHRNRL